MKFRFLRPCSVVLGRMQLCAILRDGRCSWPEYYSEQMEAGDEHEDYLINLGNLVLGVDYEEISDDSV